MDVTSRIREVIEREGPISFARFMEMALYGPDGFYEEPPIGADRHFVTNPHVHPIFGELLASALEGLWAVLGEPIPFHIVEIGAGDGTLARQLIRALAQMELKYTAAERGSVARKELEQIGEPVVAAESFDDLATFRGIVVANELLDNLPFHRLHGKDKGAVELLVGWDGTHFVDVEVPVPAEVSAAGPRIIPQGRDFAVSLEALRFLRRMAAVLLEGYVVLIDYGNSAAGEIHGYRDHRIVDDVLAAPGTADITAGVDFQTLAAHAEDLGFQVFGPVTQRHALLALGFEQWAEAQRRRQRSLLASGNGREAVKTWSDRQAATQLVDPSALGRLRWMVLATPDLPQPPWTVSDESEEEA